MTLEAEFRVENPYAVLRAATNSKQSDIWTALPGIIVSFDPVAITAQVQPAIGVLQSGPNQQKRWVQLPVLPDVPVVVPHGGKYAVTFPITAGDECVVVFSSRCIDNWWSQGGVQVQRELRMHDLSDGLCFVGPWSQATKITNWSTTTAQLRNVDGTVYAEVDDSNKTVRLVTPSASVYVDGENNFITMNAATVKVNGDLNVTGEVRRGVGTAAVVTLGGHEHGTGTPAAGTVPPTAGT